MKKILISLVMLCSMTVAWAEDDGFVNVATASQMRDALKNDHAKVRLTADIYLSDLGADFDDTFCSTFYGVLDGDGHAIKGDHYADNTTERRNRTYLFTYSEGATFKNLTFKHIRKNSQDHSNQAIITSQAKNGCVFDNITFDNVSTWTNYDNAGSAAGYATDCTFSNITVRNSDFTTDQDQSGCVVGHAIDCTFTNIKVEKCESTSAAQTALYHYGKSGGVVGRSDNCTFSNVEILGCFIKTVDEYAGGVAGYSINSIYMNCTIDDQSCVSVDNIFSGGYTYGYAGGIVGSSENDKFFNCINSALITSNGEYAGGIVGFSKEDGVIDGCLNTGLIVSMDIDDVKGGFYNKYKNKTDMTCITKTYNGKEYVIRKYSGDNTKCTFFGGIAGKIKDGNVSKCINFGSVHSDVDVAGGIVGHLLRGAISDCFSDYSASSSKVNGICGIFEGVSSINNCLNLTTYKDFSASTNNWEGFSGENNYSLTTAEDAHHVTKTTDATIKSGEICVKLGENWEQNIGTDSYPTPTGNGGLYHTRKVSNEYGTVCLPFALKSDDNISYYKLSKKEEDGQDIKLVFEYTEENEPGVPVLFRSTEGKDATADNPVEICFNNAGEDFTTTPINNLLNPKFWDLWGTFTQKVFEESTAKNIYYVSDGKIRNAKKTTIAPYRAYIYGENIDELTGSSTNLVKAIRFVIEDENGSTTALELVGDDFVPMKNNGKTFSLMGTEVGGSYRGIVIKNGKKVVIK